MSRILFVVQEDTSRCFPIPQPLGLPDTLVRQLVDLQPSTPIEIQMTDDAMQWYVLWYTAQKRNVPEDSKMAGYHERKPDHLARLALIITVADKRIKIEEEDLIASNKILTYLEGDMLTTFKWLGMRPVGVDQERLLRTLRSMGGEADRADLLRKMIYYMNAYQFNLAVDTLEQSRMIRIDQNRRFFLL